MPKVCDADEKKREEPPAGWSRGKQELMGETLRLYVHSDALISIGSPDEPGRPDTLEVQAEHTTVAHRALRDIFDWMSLGGR